MSMSSRPVSLQAALVLRRAQAARERADTVVPATPRRSGSRLARIFAFGQDLDSAGEIEPRKLAA